MSITVRRVGPPLELGLERRARAAAAAIPDIIRARVTRGLDIRDRPFAAYDAEYARVVGGRVDLDAGAAGGLLSTLRVTLRTVGDVVAVSVMPDPPHMQVGVYLHRGTKHMPARPWLGLSPRDVLALRARLSVRA